MSWFIGEGRDRELMERQAVKLCATFSCLSDAWCYHLQNRPSRESIRLFKFNQFSVCHRPEAPLRRIDYALRCEISVRSDQPFSEHTVANMLRLSNLAVSCNLSRSPVGSLNIHFICVWRSCSWRSMQRTRVLSSSVNHSCHSVSRSAKSGQDKTSVRPSPRRALLGRTVRSTPTASIRTRMVTRSWTVGQSSNPKLPLEPQPRHPDQSRRKHPLDQSRRKHPHDQSKRKHPLDQFSHLAHHPRRTPALTFPMSVENTNQPRNGELWTVTIKTKSLSGLVTARKGTENSFWSLSREVALQLWMTPFSFVVSFGRRRLEISVVLSRMRTVSVLIFVSFDEIPLPGWLSLKFWTFQGSVGRFGRIKAPRFRLVVLFVSVCQSQRRSHNKQPVHWLQWQSRSWWRLPKHITWFCTFWIVGGAAQPSWLGQHKPQGQLESIRWLKGAELHLTCQSHDRRIKSARQKSIRVVWVFSKKLREKLRKSSQKALVAKLLTARWINLHKPSITIKALPDNCLLLNTFEA